MSNNFLSIALRTALSCFAIGIGSAHAALVTSDTAFSNKKTVDFSQFQNCSTFLSTTCLPTQDVGSIVGELINFDGSGDAALYNGPYQLGVNESWNHIRQGYVALNPGARNSVTFTFQQGVSDVGAFINYAGSSHSIQALDINGGVLESYDLVTAAAISVAGNNTGAFRGISRTVADIFGFRVLNGPLVLDDLTFSRPEVVSEVPLPAAGLFLLTGLAGFSFASRQKHIAA